MGLLLAILFFLLISVAFIMVAKHHVSEARYYDMTNCRDVRATQQMIIGRAELEEKRKFLNSKKSKF